jgi:hypothetical protein
MASLRAFGKTGVAKIVGLQQKTKIPPITQISLIEFGEICAICGIFQRSQKTLEMR